MGCPSLSGYSISPGWSGTVWMFMPVTEKRANVNHVPRRDLVRRGTSATLARRSRRQKPGRAVDAPGARWLSPPGALYLRDEPVPSDPAPGPHPGGGGAVTRLQLRARHPGPEADGARPLEPG